MKHLMMEIAVIEGRLKQLNAVLNTSMSLILQVVLSHKT